MSRMAFAACAVDGFDDVREAAASALVLFPCHLPGLESPQALVPVLQWALDLAASPRGREGDAGARLLCVMYQQYGARLAWKLSVWPEVAVTGPFGSASAGTHAEGADAETRFEALVCFTSSLCDALQVRTTGHFAICLTLVTPQHSQQTWMK